MEKLLIIKIKFESRESKEFDLTTFVDSDLSNLKLHTAIFEVYSLRNVIFNYSDLRNVNFAYCNLNHSNFIKATLMNSSLVNFIKGRFGKCLIYLVQILIVLIEQKKVIYLKAK